MVKNTYFIRVNMALPAVAKRVKIRFDSVVLFAKIGLHKDCYIFLVRTVRESINRNVSFTHAIKDKTL